MEGFQDHKDPIIAQWELTFVLEEPLWKLIIMLACTVELKLRE